MEDSTQIEKFWDGVAHCYSPNSMTNHMADFEMEKLFVKLGLAESKKYVGIASFGVADGNRDPIKILQFLKDNNKIGNNFSIIANDISREMLNCTEKNIKDNGFDNYDCTYIHDELANIEDIDLNQMIFPLFCFGVYNAKFIMEALQLYKDNKEIIGKEFKITPIYSNGCLLVLI